MSQSDSDDSSVCAVRDVPAAAAAAAGAGAGAGDGAADDDSCAAAPAVMSKFWDGGIEFERWRWK